MTVAIRPGLQEDHEAAISVWAASDGARRGRPAPAEVPEKLRRRFRDPDTWLLVADDDGAIVGVAQGMTARADDGAGDPLPDLCHLSLVFVLPERWREGIGTALVRSAIQEARRRGFLRLQLWTHEDNHRSQPLYTTMGLRHTGRTKPDEQGDLIGLWAIEL